MTMAVRALIVSTALAAGALATAAHAQSGDLTGTWQGFERDAVVNLQVQANGAYAEQERKGMAWTHMSGVIQGYGPGEITFVVQDWDPKSMQVWQGGASADGGHYVQETLPRPDGGIWRVSFSAPTVMTIQNVATGETATFTRAQ